MTNTTTTAACEAKLSHDELMAIAEQFGLDVYRHPQNRSKWAVAKGIHTFAINACLHTAMMDAGKRMRAAANFAALN